MHGSGPDLAKPTARAMTPPLDPCRSARRDREARRERLLMLEEAPTLAPVVAQFEYRSEDNMYTRLTPASLDYAVSV